MTRRADPRTVLLALGELLAWWAGLALLWLVFITSLSTLELAVGAGAAAVSAAAARAGRKAVCRR
ncbi:hypothetical protein OIB37_33100 [Streptomyces sp. NBC_00820]|uniref:hypothetical protein n=1 Tax=Streptomyces sp. NBC_00820 TaxID=2975842 RepID=UPI002ED2431D|nr:hypothetical protein OIB37_33100 [Streptomyces sp. NBC_00820]